MSRTRLYQAIPLQTGITVELDEQATHHLARVLRAQAGESLVVFNGEGGEYTASILHVDKKKVTVQIENFIDRDVESPLSLCLAQGISRGEKMDYTIQKAVELGVTEIVPILTERCTVKLDAERKVKKAEHWQSIMINACEQSGRTKIPHLLPPIEFNRWLPTTKNAQGFVLAPTATMPLEKINLKKESKVVLLIGPEGGLSAGELQQASMAGFLPLNLGPRILRTETAAVAALTALQCYFGDLSGKVL